MVSKAPLKTEVMEFDVTEVGADAPRLPAETRSIVIVHSVPLIRVGLTSTITGATGFAGYSISAFATLVEAEDKISKAETGDVIIFDIGAWVSLTNKPSAFQRIKSRGPSFGVIALIEQIKIYGFGTSDLSGLIALEAECHEIIAMIENLAAFRRYIMEERVQSDRSLRLSSLNPRQTEILELITHGLSNKQIALEIGVTEGTIKYHVTKILKKLGCHLRAQAAMAFLQFHCELLKQSKISRL